MDLANKIKCFDILKGYGKNYCVSLTVILSIVLKKFSKEIGLVKTASALDMVDFSLSGIS